jgi:hypothetical protein
MINFRVVEEFELRRGPRAQVSQCIATVCDDRLFAGEHRRGLAPQIAQGQMQRSFDMGGVVLRGRKRFDYPRSLAAQTQQFPMVNCLHQYWIARARIYLSQSC